MKLTVKTALFALLIASFAGCATEEELRRRDAERAREDAREEAQDRQRNRQRDEEDWQDFLEDYARDIGKRKSELTAGERRAARSEFEGSRRYRGRHYRGWGYLY
jgi:hypothetical protein